MLESIADGLSLAAAFLAAACIVTLTGLILAEIVVAFLARFFAGMPAGIGIGWEYSAYLMGGAFMLGSGMTLRAGQQIRVELLLRAKARNEVALGYQVYVDDPKQRYGIVLNPKNRRAPIVPKVGDRLIVLAEDDG